MRILMYFLLVMHSIDLFSQNIKNDSTLAVIVTNQAERMMKAGQENDFGEFVKYMNPIMYDYPGGKEDVIADLKRYTNYSGNPKVLEYKIEPPKEFVINDKSIQCAFRFTTKVQYRRRIKKHKSFMVGVSRDGGVSWFFIDTLNKKLKELRYTFPFINENLEFK